MEQNENLEIILMYFGPINLLTPVTSSSSETESDSENDRPALTIQQQSHNQPELHSANVHGNVSNSTVMLSNTIHCGISDLRINDLHNLVVDEPDYESNSNSTGNDSLDETGIDAFVRTYGLVTVTNIFNSVNDYPSENMMTLLHRFEEERKKTLKRKYKSILKLEITKLQHQVYAREEEHRRHLLNIVLQSPNDDHMEIQKRHLFEYLSVSELFRIVLEMKGYLHKINEIDELEVIIANNNAYKKNEDYWRICQKRLKETRWSYIEKLLMNIEPIRSECHICFMDPIEYAIVDCGHYRLCKFCKEEIEKRNEPCPFCRTTITNIIKVYE